MAPATQDGDAAPHDPRGQDSSRPADSDSPAPVETGPVTPPPIAPSVGRSAIPAPRLPEPQLAGVRGPDVATDRPVECDVVLQGGTASGVIYPRALAALARRNRLRGIGGTSAGAMAAAVAAAAEYGRTTGRGGFKLFESIPQELGGGRLLGLFQPLKSTRPLFDLLLVLTGGDRPDGRSGLNKIIASIGVAVRGYPLAAALAALPGLVLIILGAISAGVWAIVLGVVVLLVAELITLPAAILINLGRDVPAHDYGICSGRSIDGRPAITDWLESKITEAAGLTAEDPPLTFGQLWTAGQPGADASARAVVGAEQARSIDLRVITTCLSERRPYELPFDSHRFFYDSREWARIFPPSVMTALAAAPEPRVPQDGDPVSWRADHDEALRHSPDLHRLPDAEYLPVVVAARMSLSMPLMIAAVPLWVVQRVDIGDDDQRLDPTGPRRFVKVWFSDGGLSSNFPVQLFDSALPTRPTYAINLQNFPPGVGPKSSADEDAEHSVEWAHGNDDGVVLEVARWPTKGLAAIFGFFAAIYNSSSSWQDNTQLNEPGYRDRIVRVLQTAREGGINLAMSDATIERLAHRGEYAANMIMDQFDEPRYPPVVDGKPTSTGWDNHRWVRYRALLSVLPTWADSYRRGRAVLGDGLAADPPSYRFESRAEADLAAELDAAMDRLAQVVAEADPDALADVMARPRPVGAIRRVPQI